MEKEESEFEKTSLPIRYRSFPQRFLNNKRGGFGLSSIAFGFAQLFISLLVLFTGYFFIVIIMGNFGNLVLWMFQGFQGNFPVFSSDDAVYIIQQVFSIMGPAIEWTLYIFEWFAWYILVLLRIVNPYTFPKPTPP